MARSALPCRKVTRTTEEGQQAPIGIGQACSDLERAGLGADAVVHEIDGATDRLSAFEGGYRRLPRALADEACARGRRWIELEVHVDRVERLQECQARPGAGPACHQIAGRDVELADGAGHGRAHRRELELQRGIGHCGARGVRSPPELRGLAPTTVHFLCGDGVLCDESLGAREFLLRACELCLDAGQFRLRAGQRNRVGALIDPEERCAGADARTFFEQHGIECATDPGSQFDPLDRLDTAGEHRLERHVPADGRDGLHVRRFRGGWRRLGLSEAGGR